MADIVRFAGISASESFTYAIKDLNGTTVHVLGANMIRTVSQALHVRHDVVAVKESEIFNLIRRSEVDLILTPIAQADFLSEDIKFSYPTAVSEWSFMTTKPEPVPKTFAVVHPFSYLTWVALATVFISLTLLFYIFMNRKIKYLSILFDVFGSLLEQSVTFEVGRNNSRMILTSWLLGAMILSYGYKAVLLSSLTFPSTNVIRDIPDFIKAESEGLVECFGAIGDISMIANFDSDAWRAAYSCLERNEYHNYFEEFYCSTSKKVYMNEREGLSFFERDFFISEDSFSYDIYSYPVSKNFCCLKKLNTLILRIEESGIYKRIKEEEKYFFQLKLENMKREMEPEKKNWEIEPEGSSGGISISDISGAFFILLFGWLLAFFTLIGEIFIHKYGTRNM